MKLGPTIFVLIAAFASVTAAAPISRDQLTVTDGDTIRIDGEPVRLVGFNAPETSNARCDLERELGDRATARLEALVAGGGVTFEKVACACQPGTEGTDRGNYGRACGTLQVDGRDVGDILMAEALAGAVRVRRNELPTGAQAVVRVTAARWTSAPRCGSVIVQ